MALVTLQRKSSIHVQQRGAGFATSSLLLDRFLPQGNAGSERQRLMRENPAVKELARAFSALMKYDVDTLFSEETRHSYLLETIRIKPTAEEVGLFSAFLGKFKDETYRFAANAGLFLSVLINSSDDRFFRVPTSHLFGGIRFLGYKNTKDIEVFGDAGHNFGNLMSSGKAVVHGDALDDCGNRLGGGEIFVEGNAANQAGSDMTSGKLTVLGSVLEGVGFCMKGGELDIHGSAGSDLSDFAGIALGMKGGYLRVRGNVLSRVGTEMDGGTIEIGGNIAKLAPGDYNWHYGGDVIHGGVKIVSDGELLDRSYQNR